MKVSNTTRRPYSSIKVDLHTYPNMVKKKTKKKPTQQQYTNTQEPSTVEIKK